MNLVAAKKLINPRTTSFLAWSMCALSLALTALGLFLLLLNLSHPEVPVYPYWAINTLIVVGFSPVGAVIVPRLSPKNPIGWVFCATGLLFGVTHLSAEYDIYALLAAPGTLPGGEAAAWIFSLVGVPAVGLLVFVGLLFPDGRLPSHRWRWFFWLSVFLILAGTISQASLGVEGVPDTYKPIQTLLFTLMFVSAASLFIRRVRARGVERQQLKWFTYATTLAISGSILTYTISEAVGLVWLGRLGYALILVGLIGIPVSMGIAILRYRLYEIDLIINRTLVYGALTILLALVYLVGVISLQYLLRLLTGEESNLAIVASTLVIAALFNPLRRRIQSFVDRRFYRRKYDAAKILGAFGSRLRNQTDLERISEDLTAVVHETLHPAYVSLWLRPASSPDGSKESNTKPEASKAETR